MPHPLTTPAAATPALPRRLLMLGVLAVVVVLAYWPASVALFDFWTDVENLGGTHGFLVLAVSGWVLFENRRAIAAADARPSLLGLGLLAACSVGWLILCRAGLQDLHLLLVPLLFWLAVFAAFGWGVARQAICAAGLLYFALPIWGHAAIPLQTLTTHAVGFLARAAGIPVHISGHLVQIPEGLFEVAEGCSGVHFFVVGLLIAALHGELMRASLRRRAVLFAVLGGVAILANWVRVFSIVLAGHLTNMKHPLITKGHYWFGWGVFAVAMVLFFVVESRFSSPAKAKSEGGEPSPLDSSFNSDNRGWRLALVVLIVAPAFAFVVDRLLPPANVGRVAMPTAISGWVGPQQLTVPWAPEFAGEHQQAVGAYRSANGALADLAIVIYPAQRQGAELVSDYSFLLGRDTSFEVPDHVVHTAFGAFRESRAIDAGGRRFLVWSRYDVDGQSFAMPLLSQLWYGLRSLAGAPVSSLTAVRAPCVQDCDEARTQIERFWQQSHNELQAAVRASLARSE